MFVKNVFVMSTTRGTNIGKTFAANQSPKRTADILLLITFQVTWFELRRFSDCCDTVVFHSQLQFSLLLLFFVSFFLSFLSSLYISPSLCPSAPISLFCLFPAACFQSRFLWMSDEIKIKQFVVSPRRPLLPSMMASHCPCLGRCITSQFCLLAA